MTLKRAHSEIEDDNVFKRLELDDESEVALADPPNDWHVVEKKQKLSRNQLKKLRRKQRAEQEQEQGARNELSSADREQSASIPEKSSTTPITTARIGKKKKSTGASITFSPHTRLNSWVRSRDLQGLILYLLADEHSPQWVAVNGRQDVERVVVLQVPGLDADLFSGRLPLIHSTVSETVTSQNKSIMQPSEKIEFKDSSPDDYYPTELRPDTLHRSLRPLAAIFSHRWPVRASGEDKSQFLWSSSRSMLSSVIPKTKEAKKKQHAGTLDTSHWVNQPEPITSFVASLEDLANCEYVLHPAMFACESDRQALVERRKRNMQSADDGWVDSLVDDFNLTSSQVNNDDPEAQWSVIAMDCEMCKTSGTDFELARISIVSWKNEVLLDELVKPPRPITDYLTQYSGITKEMLEPVSTTLEDIQQKLLQVITSRTIIIGHSLNSDFNALKFCHPYVIDTSIIFPHPRGPPLRSSLKYLTQKYLDREIQSKTGSSGHDSIEDARAVLDLVKQKCERGVDWGMAGMSDEPMYKRLRRNLSKRKGADGNTSHLRTAHVHYKDHQNNYGTFADRNITCVSDAEIKAGVLEALSNPNDVNFVWAELRKLEETRGWRHIDLKFPGSRNDIGKVIAKVPQTTDPSAEDLTSAVDETVSRISEIYTSLPEGTVFMVYSGAADRREWLRLQHQHQQFKREYQTKKWDELSVRWTDVEEQALRRAYRAARDGGLGLITVRKLAEAPTKDDLSHLAQSSAEVSVDDGLPTRSALQCEAADEHAIKTAVTAATSNVEQSGVAKSSS